MAVNFTPEQTKVIELHNCNILVSAAAGSGKTAVLVERIIRMVCDEQNPVDIDRLLIVTFTKAAAAEMRERIANGIGEKLRENPGSEHIQRQATLLHNALITTIDSFSLFLIRNHFNEIGLDPAFRVADEGEIKLMQQDVLQELLEDKYREGTEQFSACVEYFCPGETENQLETHILDLSRYAASFPWPQEWLLQRKEDYRVDTVEELCHSDYGHYLVAHTAKMLQGCVKKLSRALEICQEADGPYMYAERLEQELEALEELTGCKQLEEYWEKLPGIVFANLPGKKDKTISPEKKEMAQELRNGVKEVVKELVEAFYATPMELVLEQGRQCRGPVSTLIDLVVEFDLRMKQKKQEKKLVTFSDMEHYALDILLTRKDGKVYPSRVAGEYRQYFHEILIDEYQDSNLVQEYLLGAVSGEEEGKFNRFMVGDVKQSIYKFRLARPELFLEKYNTYQAEEGKRRRIDLSKNFRSRDTVIHGVNDIFSRIMSKEIGGIAYDHAAALYVGATYPENKDCAGEVLLVEKPGKEVKENAKEAEAMALAMKIKQLLGSYQVTDKETGQLRPVRYSDMVILLRTNTGWDEVFKRVLAEEGIPAYITTKTGYFAATEVQELLHILRVLDNPGQDIPLYGVMKSIFGGFTEEEIAGIRGREKGCSLYQALKNFTHNDAGEESDDTRDLITKTDHFLGRIERYRHVTSYMTIRELLQYLVDSVDYMSYITALPEGSKRRANVEMLFTKASDFEKTSYFGLFHFIRYMEQLETYDVDYGEADVLDENADVVRIMSIHKSKGLEFPVTFVAGMAKKFNMQDTYHSLVVDMDMGLATNYVNPTRRLRNKTLRYNVISQKMQEDNLAEELRVLYVALTRAKEKLILTACMEKAEETWEHYRGEGADELSYIDYVKAKNYMDFLLPVLSRTSMEVSVIDGERIAEAKIREQIELYHNREQLKWAGELADRDALAGLQERFGYVYPYENLRNLYTKTTVSELKIAAMAERDEGAFHAFEEREIVPYLPQFISGEERVSGTVRGNAYHRVMELIDFKKLLGSMFVSFPESYQEYRQGFDFKVLQQSLHNFLTEEVKQLRLTEEYFKAVREQKIVYFLSTQTAYRMWAADKRGELYREQPFVFGISADRINQAFPREETVLIQGIIDVFFIEDGKIVLLDYKTDVIDSMEALRKRYETQLDYYGEALEKMMNAPVAEKILYSFYLEQ